VVYGPDVADLHVRAEQAPVGSRYIGSDHRVSLEDFARAVHDIDPSAKVPRTRSLTALLNSSGCRANLVALGPHDSGGS